MGGPPAITYIVSLDFMRRVSHARKYDFLNNSVQGNFLDAKNNGL